MFWLRGNRVYDFHGDRGTVADFEADLLTREVEDDATCRSRRQSLGDWDGAVTIILVTTSCYSNVTIDVMQDSHMNPYDILTYIDDYQEFQLLTVRLCLLLCHYNTG